MVALLFSLHQKGFWKGTFWKKIPASGKKAKPQK
jgi:hypothetical protein